jgi:peptide/nickel transport system substrate-binding protein
VVNSHLIAAAACVLTLLSTVGCGPGVSSRSDGPGTAPLGPKKLIIGQGPGAEPTDGGVALGGGGGNQYMQFIVNAGLTVYDEGAAVQPRIAERVPSIENGDWQTFPDGRMELTWRLRPDVRWQDGTPLTADDLLLAYKVETDPELFDRGSAVLGQISEMTAPDSRTLVIRWKSLYVFANELGLSTLVPLPSHLLGPLHEKGDKPAFTGSSYLTDDWVGLGPYRLKEWARGSFMTLTAYDDYFLGKPNIDELTLRFVGDTNTLLVRMLSGDVDMVPVGPFKLGEAATLNEQFVSQGKGEIILSSVRLRVGRWQLRDSSLPWVPDPSVRQALIKLIDRRGMLLEQYGGMGDIQDILLDRKDPAYRITQEKGVVDLSYDVSEAHRLLAAAGFTRGADGTYRSPSGVPFAIELAAQTDIATNVREVQIVQDFWKGAGLQVDLVLIPGTVRWQEVGAQLKGVYIGGANPGYAAYSSLTTGQISAPPRWNGGNMGGYSNPTADQLYARIGAELNGSQRSELMAQMAKLTLDEVSYLPLRTNDDLTALRKGITGIHAVLPDQRAEFWNMHTWDIIPS